MFSGWGKLIKFSYSGIAGFIPILITAYFCVSASALVITAPQAVDGAASTWFSCALDNAASNKPYCWGVNPINGNKAAPVLPSAITALNTQWNGISLGAKNICLTKAQDNSTWCWDYEVSKTDKGWAPNTSRVDGNYYYLRDPEGPIMKSAILRQSNDSPGKGCSVDSAGGLLCWGFKKWSWSPVAEKGSNPPKPKADASVVRATSRGIGTVVDVDVEGLNACVLKTDQTVFCWSDSPVVQAAIAKVPEGLQAASVSVGIDHACASQVSDGRPVCWGVGVSNSDGSQPAMPPLSRVKTDFASKCLPPVNGEDGSPLAGCRSRGLVSGAGWSCAVLDSNSNVFCWGKTSGVSINQKPFGAEPARSLIAGRSHVCMVNDNGLISCKTLRGLPVYSGSGCGSSCLMNAVSGAPASIAPLTAPVATGVPPRVTYTKGATIKVGMSKLPAGTKIAYTLGKGMNLDQLKGIKAPPSDFIANGVSSTGEIVLPNNIPLGLVSLTLTAVSGKNRSIPTTYVWKVAATGESLGVRSTAYWGGDLASSRVPDSIIGKVWASKNDDPSGFGVYPPGASLPVAIELADNNDVLYRFDDDAAWQPVIKGSTCEPLSTSYYESMCTVILPASAGYHQVSIKQVSSSGVDRGAAKVYSFLIDGQKPSKPTLTLDTPSTGSSSSLVTRVTNADFTISDLESYYGGLGCSLDGAAVQDCSDFGGVKPHFENLDPGSHKLQVVTYDLAGNDSTPTSVSWKVDPKPPVFTIKPSPFTNQKQPHFEWNKGDLPATHFSCSLVQLTSDPAVPETLIETKSSCGGSAGGSYTPSDQLEDGDYYLKVNQIGPRPSDGVVTVIDSSQFDFSVDTASPAQPHFQCTISNLGYCQPRNSSGKKQDIMTYDDLTGHDRAVQQRKAQFVVSGAETAARFECSLDGQIMKPVNSDGGKVDFCDNYGKGGMARSAVVGSDKPLAYGYHTFQIVQIDAAGNRSAPSIASWYVYPGKAGQWKLGIAPTLTKRTDMVFRLNGEILDGTKASNLALADSVDITVHIDTSDYMQNLVDKLYLDDDTCKVSNLDAQPLQDVCGPGKIHLLTSRDNQIKLTFSLVPAKCGDPKKTYSLALGLAYSAGLTDEIAPGKVLTASKTKWTVSAPKCKNSTSL